MKFYGGSTAFYGFAESASFYAGGGVSAEVPTVFPVAIDGQTYLVDLDQPFYRQYRRQIAPLIRTQADTSKLPGEQTMDPNGLWRRSFEDWSEGAGQRYLDRDTSVDNGFWQSKGIDALTTKWQISLLPDTTKARASANTNLQAVVCNGRVYIADGQTLAYTTSLTSPSFTPVTGTPAQTLSSLTTDGFTVYAAYGPSGIYSSVSTGSTATQYVTSAIGAGAVIGYVNGRLMLGNNYDGSNGDGKLYNIVASGTLPTPLLAPYAGNNATWVGFANGDNNLYGAVNVGGVGLLYGTTTTSDGTALTAPTVQGQLPNGETFSSVYGYLGQLIVGTSLGVRYSQPTSTGAVEWGSLISGQVPNGYGPTASTQCMFGYGHWVWFGWTNYDGTSTGLGKLDLENFVEQNVLPAMASDRMATTQGAVTGVAVFGGTVIFGVSGQGFYTDSANLVSSGTIVSGYVLYDLIDPKITSLLDVQTVGPLVYGSYSAAIATDGGSFVSVLTHIPGDPEPVAVSLPGNSGQRFELQLTLNRDSSTLSKGPVITRWTMRVYPAPRRPVTWQLPLVFSEDIVDQSGNTMGFNTFVQLQRLEQLAANGTPVTYQEQHQSFQVYVQDVQFIPTELTSDKTYFNGLCLVALEGLPAPN